MEDDFVDVFPSAGGVGDSPVKTSVLDATSGTSPWPKPSISLSIPGLDTGGAAAAVSPAVPGSHGVATPSPAKEAVLRSTRSVSAVGEDDDMESPVPSPLPFRLGLAPALTIDPGGDCVPTELEKKRAKLERFRFECSEVSESFIYVSGEDAAKRESVVRSKGITHIINCAGPQCPNYLEYTGRFKFLRLNFYDHRTEDVAWFMYEAFDFMAAAKAQRGRVLVHCVQGVSRSCTLAIAWLMLTTGIDYDDAYIKVRQGRPICAPNTGFICSLLEWLKRRKQPPSSPLMYRTAWHVPLFPNDLVLKICLHEDDRSLVAPTLSSLDPRGCYLLVVPRDSPAPSPVTPMKVVEIHANGSVNGDGCLGGLGSGGGDTPEEVVAGVATAPSSSSSLAVSPPVLSCFSSGAAASSSSAAAAAAAAAASAAATAAAAAAATAAEAAEEALRASKAMQAGVAVPWTWKESEVGVARREARPVLNVRPVAGVAVGGQGEPAGAAEPPAAGRREAGGTDVYVWKGSQSNPQMLELARTGARWLKDYEGWGAGVGATVVEQGQEPREFLRHLEQSGACTAREPPVYGDLTSPSPPPTTGARFSSGSAFQACATPSTRISRAPVLSPAEPPMLSPAGPSPSPGGGGGVGFSPYGSGVSPAGSTVVSPAQKLYMGLGDNPMSRRCSVASATEEVDEDNGYYMVGMSSMGDGSPTAGAARGGNSTCGVGVGGHRGGSGSLPRLFELADELGGVGTSGLRWSELAMFDDQDLLPQCCFLLVTPGVQNFLWVGQAFATVHIQEGENLQQMLPLARDVAVRDARRDADRIVPAVADIEEALLVAGDGNESQEWWSAFEASYV